ncbi:hypothetical protein C8F04DRAFT_1135054, partial [Mycena alexandri]
MHTSLNSPHRTYRQSRITEMLSTSRSTRNIPSTLLSLNQRPRGAWPESTKRVRLAPQAHDSTTYTTTLLKPESVSMCISSVTGIKFDHVDFGGRVEGGYVYPGGESGDEDGHGTHVAGIVGGGTYGVAKSVTLHEVKV